MTCLPIKSASGKYTVIWFSKEDEDEDVEGYSTTQTECYQQLLEAHIDLSMTTDSPNDFEWWNGGSSYFHVYVLGGLSGYM